MLAMSLPGTVRALGLGDIRVDSALNEPLSAQIDIVGATREELAALTASVANREIFQRYGADRPSFLSTATFKVGIDSQGRAVLNVRSAEAFTDPLVSFLVEIRWGKNEFVREYSLLLDPPNYKFPRTSAEAAFASAAPSAAPGVAVPAAAAPPAESPAHMPTAAVPAPGPGAGAGARRGGLLHASDAPFDPAGSGHDRITIEAGDTLRAVARRLGARTETQAQTLMIAIFRANPEAFDGNINRLHRGAILAIPTSAEVAAVSSVEARREVRAHMTAWRLDGRPAATPRTAPAAQLAAALPAGAGTAAASTPGAPTAPGAHESAPVARDEEPVDASLRSRVQSLEQQLDEMHKQLASENEKIQALRMTESAAPAAQAPTRVAQAPTPVAQGQGPVAQAPTPDAARSAELVSAPIIARATKAPPATVSAPAATTKTSSAEIFAPVALTLGLMVAGFAYVRRRWSPARSPAVAALEPEPLPIPAPDLRFGDRPVAAPLYAVTSPEEPSTPMEASPPFSRHEEPMTVDTIEEPMPFANADTSDLEIDVEALERSYLESLPSEAAAQHAAHQAAAARDATASVSAAVDPALADTTTVKTVSIERPELEKGLGESDLNTVLMDVEALDRAHGGARPEAKEASANNTVIDFNLVDLDDTVHHVHMASDLREPQEIAERRMNIVDVLKAAIEKDPNRRDLRMKLLETYYNLASLNQRAFMDVVRKLSRERDLLSADDWKKVTLMGREIAADDILFADLDPPKDPNDLANCA
jgi:FimV-like protein